MTVSFGWLGSFQTLEKPNWNAVIPQPSECKGMSTTMYEPLVLSELKGRASLVPAAAVIPAPKAYTKIVAVETLVV